MPKDRRLAALNTWLSGYGGKPATLASACGISYHAARRMLQRGVENLTENAQKLEQHICTSDTSAAPAAALPGQIAAAVRETWDGTQGHADLIVAVLRGTKGFQVASKSDRPS